MESNSTSAIFFQMQLHPSDAFSGKGNILFFPQGHMKLEMWEGAEGELLFPGSHNQSDPCVWPVIKGDGPL